MLVDEVSTILVIDDDTLFLESVLELLEDQGFQVIGAFNGVLDYQLALEFNPDLIIYNLEISGFSGYEVLNCFRQTPRIAQIPLIVMASEFSESLREKVLNLGASDYFAKPFLIDRFLNTIQTLLAQKEECRKS